MSLGRMEIAALKRMEKSLHPLVNKLHKIDEKLEKIISERKEIEGQYKKIAEVMDTYAGGSYKEVLYGTNPAEVETQEEGILAEASEEIPEELFNEVEAEESTPWV
jgi:chorismate mutase